MTSSEVVVSLLLFCFELSGWHDKLTFLRLVIKEF